MTSSSSHSGSRIGAPRIENGFVMSGSRCSVFSYAVTPARVASDLRRSLPERASTMEAQSTGCPMRASCGSSSVRWMVRPTTEARSSSSIPSLTSGRQRSSAVRSKAASPSLSASRCASPSTVASAVSSVVCRAARSRVHTAPSFLPVERTDRGVCATALSSPSASGSCSDVDLGVAPSACLRLPKNGDLPFNVELGCGVC
mmetsp:Transcript_38955/g.85639  ORF Transcript_38955/g.85639 Transcript_38955/m.85639 type:complete len:201 (-) Transcript_38955:740-1342(-)